MITLIDLFEQWYCGRLILILGPCSECFLMLLLLRTMIQIHLLLSGRSYQVRNEGWPVESSICSNGWRAMETTTHSGPVNHSGNKQSSISFSYDHRGAMIFPMSIR